MWCVLVSTIASFARLQRIGAPVFTTAEAAAALRRSGSAASRALRTLSEHGLVERIRHGMWRLGDAADPRTLVREITRPYPSYVSFESALSAHGMIDQLPREIGVASLGRPRKVETSAAVFAIHRLPPRLFGGFSDEHGFPLATPEKALFDWCYVTRARGAARLLPELELPATFSRAEVERWLERIADVRLRRRVAETAVRLIEGAVREEGPRADPRRPPAMRPPGAR